MRPPPSTIQWFADGDLNGHTVEQTLQYLSDCADWNDYLTDRVRR